MEAAAAAELLAAHAPALAVSVRERLLAEAAGNPLALVELPVALGSDQLGKGVLPEWLPLTARLERAFAARVSELPAVTRRAVAPNRLVLGSLTPACQKVLERNPGGGVGSGQWCS
jgi:hypothetical protein